MKRERDAVCQDIFFDDWILKRITYTHDLRTECSITVVLQPSVAFMWTQQKFSLRTYSKPCFVLSPIELGAVKEVHIQPK